ncbi:LuxR family transcriptional regulator [Nostoc sp. FACHB-87]|uniref:LuxR C-terminal-related transcriptional regulator n=1 Tax=Nostocaceae TaxID=1162 RepID=UPI00168205B1|nr:MULTISPECIES: LuxR C-terminal-related transcriptional regulator [Nostocaceae]MBD2454275.1 LuxR family transcriptional regulator [Nostoc sp. FACHB-87]MBD2474132.1 LuxR family transcriptional regulator [Anabaena sp. FACHB-83]
MVALQDIFRAIAQAQDEQTLRSHISTDISQYFAATRSGLFFFDQTHLIDKAILIALSPQYNPVARYLLERHAPVHEALVVEPKTWKLICPRPDHYHVMAGPIVSTGKLVGALGFTRQQNIPAFDSQNLTDLSAICLHISTWVTMTKSPPPPFQTANLTPREVEIATLVAQGCSNAEISRELWITQNSVKQALKRMFRKLEVSSRTQMLAKLSKITQFKQLPKK